PNRNSLDEQPQPESRIFTLAVVLICSLQMNLLLFVGAYMPIYLVNGPAHLSERNASFLVSAENMALVTSRLFNVFISKHLSASNRISASLTVVVAALIVMG